MAEKEFSRDLGKRSVGRRVVNHARVLCHRMQAVTMVGERHYEVVLR